MYSPVKIVEAKKWVIYMSLYVCCMKPETRKINNGTISFFSKLQNNFPTIVIDMILLWRYNFKKNTNVRKCRLTRAPRKRASSNSCFLGSSAA